ncbi:MAG: hypothetical protein KC502_11625 [Myxococcales bacterium]|nr:hypothetical protein [Myxococcales bacterium]
MEEADSHRRLRIALTVGLLLLGLAGVAWNLAGESTPQHHQVETAPAMEMCMSTCTRWHLMSSLHKRATCPKCENLPTCKRQRRHPTSACIAELRSCYAVHGCLPKVERTCVKRCTKFVRDHTPQAPTGPSGAPEH